MIDFFHVLEKIIKMLLSMIKTIKEEIEIDKTLVSVLNVI